jgi:hypothetical protein
VSRGIVAISDRIGETRRKRFTIAHEIGHYILPGHGVADIVCTDKQIEAWPENLVDQEREANCFASELLLPSEQIETIVSERGASIETARFVSEVFETSLMAASLKCIDVTDDACALVVSINGVVRSYRPSRSWRYIILVGCRLGPGTLAQNLDLDKRHASGVVTAVAWTTSNKMIPGAEVLEDSIYLPRYSIVLSLLTAIGP